MPQIRCEICQSCHLDSVDALKIHFATQHLTSAVYVMVVLVHPEKTNLRSKHLKCLFCLAKFPDFAGLSTHLRSFHPEIDFPEDPPCVSEMFCLQCVEKFPTHPQLTTHFKVVHNLTKCPCPCELPIGESEMARSYKQQLIDSPYNYNKEDSQEKPKARLRDIRDVLKRKRAMERGEEVDEEGAEEPSTDDDNDEEEDEEEGEEVERILMESAEELEGGEGTTGGDSVKDEGEILPEAGIKTFNQIFRYERHRLVWSCGCCKKEFLTKNELSEHMRAPDHEKALTYLLATYKFGKLVSCVSHSIKLNGLYYWPPEEDPKFVLGVEGGGGASIRDNPAEFRCPRCDEAFNQDIKVEEHLKESDCLRIPVAVKGTIRDQKTYGSASTSVAASPSSTASSSSTAVANFSASAAKSSTSTTISSASTAISISARVISADAAASSPSTYTRRQKPTVISSSSGPRAAVISSSSSHPPPPKRMTVILSPEETSGIKVEQQIKIEIQDDGAGGNFGDIQNRRSARDVSANFVKSELA